jgi:hypothetical protein
MAVGEISKIESPLPLPALLHAARPLPHCRTAAAMSSRSSASRAAPDVRRSIREAGAQQLEKQDVKKLIKKIHENSPDTVILKIKDHMVADINCAVVDAIIAALPTCAGASAKQARSSSRSNSCVAI